KALANIDKVNHWIRETIAERTFLVKNLIDLEFVEHIYPSDANFILIKTADPLAVYEYLNQARIIVRDRSKVVLCEGCLRITVGTSEENKSLLDALRKFK